MDEEVSLEDWVRKQEAKEYGRDSFIDKYFWVLHIRRVRSLSYT